MSRHTLNALVVAVLCPMATAHAGRPGGGLGGGLTAVPAFQGVRIDPVRIASMAKIDGRYVMTSDWVPYGGFSGREIPSGCLFDCFGRDWSLAATGVPLGCPRYSLGSSYNLPNCNDDMSQHRNGRVTEFDWAWIWKVPVGSQLFTAVFVGNGDPNGCTPLTEGSGIILDYGYLAAGNGFYFSNVDLLSVPFQISLTGATSYQLILASAYDGEAQRFTLSEGPCQPLLYGTPGNLRQNAASSIGVGAYGDQGPKALDDDGPTDGIFDPAAECHSFDFGPGLCENWLGKMVAFGGCAVDFDGDGFATGDDFDAFVAAFALGDASADYDGDGFVTGDDFDEFVAEFELGC